MEIPACKLLTRMGRKGVNTCPSSSEGQWKLGLSGLFSKYWNFRFIQVIIFINKDIGSLHLPSANFKTKNYCKESSLLKFLRNLMPTNCRYSNVYYSYRPSFLEYDGNGVPDIDSYVGGF